MSNELTKVKKFSYCLNNYVTVHIIVIILTILKIFFQNFLNKQCWMLVCECSNDFQIKIFSTFSWIFLLYNILIVTVYKTSIEVNIESLNCKIICFAIYYAICFIFSFGYLLQLESEMNSIPIFICLIVVPYIFQIKIFFEYKNFGFPLLKHLFIVNIVGIITLIHYFLYTRIFPELNGYLNNIYNDSLASNLIRFYQFFYFRIYSLACLKLYHIYNRFILSFKFNEYTATIFLIRFCSVFFVAVPVASIINMKNFDDWGGWIMIFSYANFVFSFYTRIDLFAYFFTSLYHYIRKTKKKEINQDPIDVLCSHLISGSLIDLMFLINSRLIILMVGKRWYTYPVDEKFYKDCSFEINESKFIVNIYGAIAIIGINTFISFSLIVYMYYKKQLFLEYKKPKNFLLNLYFLLVMHSSLEGSIQMIIAVN